MRNFHFLSFLFFLTVFDVNADNSNYLGLTNLSNKHLSDVTITGPANLNNLTSESLKVIGPSQFDKLAVSGESYIIGPVNGKNGKLNQLTVTGPLSLWKSEVHDLKVIGYTNLENVTVSDKTEIIGFFEAKKSRMNDLIVTSNNIKLHDTTVKNITINKCDNRLSSLKEQILEIQGKTTINGNITFESNLGKILLSKDSKINGKVEGAKIHNLDK